MRMYGWLMVGLLLVPAPALAGGSGEHRERDHRESHRHDRGDRDRDYRERGHRDRHYEDRDHRAQYDWGRKPIDWNGFYLGITGGGAQIRSLSTTTVTSEGHFTPESAATLEDIGQQSVDNELSYYYGVQAGHNSQSGDIVFGWEADYGKFKTGASNTIGPIKYPDFVDQAGRPIRETNTYSIVQEAHVNWLATLRPRIGLAAGSALFYATGGLAAANITTNFQFSDTFRSTASGTHTALAYGWTAGGGVEYAMSDDWSLKADYLFVQLRHEVDLTSNNLRVRSVAIPEEEFTHTTEDFKMHLGRLSLTYRF